MAKEKQITVDLSADPDPLPKVGDTINYVQPSSKKTVQALVMAVNENGRSVQIEVIEGTGDKAKKKIVTLPHRPQEALAGNTWHWPAVLLLCVLLALSAIKCFAGLPTYKTFGPATGTSTVLATILMPADPNSQIRVVNMLYTSDNAAAQFSFSSGTTAFTVTSSNTLSSITNLINSTNGLTSLSTSNLLVLQHNGTCYTNSVNSWGTYANGQAWLLMPSAFSIGSTTVSASAGDNIYLMSTPSSWFAGSTTNALNGDDIFSGNYGRPVMLQLGPATTITRLSAVSTHYDSASQP